MIKRSVNEIYHTARKACLARGVYPDIAEDFAHCALWLHRADKDGCAALIEMLSGSLPSCKASYRCEETRLVTDSLSPKKGVISIIDWLVSRPEKHYVHASCLEYPLFVFGLLGYRANCYKLAFDIEMTDHNHVMTIAPNACDVVTLPSFNGKFTLSARSVDVPTTTPATISVFPPYILVADALWTELSQLAFQTYVPPSQASRMSGAGAGLVDND